MHGEPEPPRLVGDDPEQVVLQRLVLGVRGRPAVHVPGVHPVGRRRVGGREVQAPQVGRLELDRHRPGLLLSLERRHDDADDVLVQGAGRGAEAQITQVAPQEGRLPGIQGAGVRRARRLAPRVEREEERVVERDPAEPDRIEPRTHGHPVGEHHLDPGLVQGPVREAVPQRPERAVPGRLQRLPPGGIRIGGRGSVQGRGRPGPHRRRQGQAPREGEGRDSVQRKGVELGVGRGAGRDGPHRVRVVVDRADPGDGAGQARVHGHGAAPRAAARRSGTWARLRRDRAGREQESQGEDGRGGDRGARQRDRTGPGRASTHGGFLSSSGCRGGRRGCRAPSSWTDSPCSSPPPSPPGRPGPSPARR